MPTTKQIEHYRAAYLARTPSDNFDRGSWNRLNILSTSVDPSGENPKVYFSISIPRQFSNHNGTAHGGALATLFDGITVSAVGLIAKPGIWDGAQVSRTLDIKYYRPVPLEQIVNAEVEILHAGKNLATVRGIIKRESDGALLAACQHELFHPPKARL